MKPRRCIPFFIVFCIFCGGILNNKLYGQTNYSVALNKHCPALPIARFNEVPYQLIENNYELGVIAFHKDGINRVEFSSTDGVNTVNATATQFSLNPRTNTREYWTIINPSQFNDTTLTITATVYANTGESRVLDFLLYANSRQTVKEDTLYVSTNGSDTNTGELGSPVQTIEKALSILRASKKNPAVILIMDEGVYDLPDITVGHLAIKNNYFITIKSNVGLNPSNVILERPTRSVTRMNTHLVKWEGVTFDFAKAPQYYALGNKAVWFHNVRWTNSLGWDDPCAVTPGCTPAPTRGASYVTNSISTNMLYAFTGQLLVRNCEVKNCIGDVFQNSRLVVNCTVDTVDGSVVEHHTDLYQMFGEMDNTIVYGLTATNLISTQAIFLEPTYLESAGSPRNKLSNSAFVDINVHHLYQDSLIAENGGAPFSQMLSWFEHVIFENVKLPGQLFLMRTDLPHNQWWSSSNVVFKKCQFHPKTYSGIITGKPTPGVSYIDSYTTYPDCSDGIQNGTETGIDCGTSCLRDEDGDGYYTGYCNLNNTLNDCDDNNPAIHPGIAEILNGIDNNCDGLLHPDHSSDFDGDGIINGLDNCIYVANSDQTDYDLDNIGDNCDSLFTYTENVENRNTGETDLVTLKARNGLNWEVARGRAAVAWNSSSKDKDIQVPIKGVQSGNHMLLCLQGRNTWSNITLSLDIAVPYSGSDRGFVVLYQDTNNFYFFNLSGGAMKKRINGNDVTLGSSPVISKAHGELSFIHYTARVITDTSGVRFYISKNGSAEVMFYDSLPHVTAGSIGLIAEKNPSDGKNLGLNADNIIVEVPTTSFPYAYNADIIACKGTPVILTATGGFGSYSWSTGSTTQSISVTTPGSYWVSAQDSTGCGASETTTVAFYNAVALGADKLFCPGDSFLVSAGNGFTNYLWTTGETTQGIIATSPGIYGVNVVDENGCLSSDSVIISVDPTCVTSLEKYSRNATIKIIPSFNDGHFRISIEQYTLRGDMEIKIITTSGQVIYNKYIFGITQAVHTQDINLSSVSTGLYFVQIRIGSEIFSDKIIVERM